MKKIFIAICIVLLVLLSGCASIVRGTTQDIPVNSYPSNAEIYISGQGFINNQVHSLTPNQITFIRKFPYTITIKKYGYIDYSIQITPVMDAAIAGNLFLGGIIGGAIDASSGAAYSLIPSMINANLQRDNLIPDSLIVQENIRHNTVNYQPTYYGNTHKFNRENVYTINLVNGTVLENVRFDYLYSGSNYINYKFISEFRYSRFIYVKTIESIIFNDQDVTQYLIQNGKVK